MLPALHVALPLPKWGASEVAIDAWHHTVHVVGTLVAFNALTRIDC